MKKRIIFHPFIFSIYPLLALYLQNNGKVPYLEVIIIASLILLSVVLLWLILNRFIANINKSASIVSVFFLLFFSFGHILPNLVRFIVRALGMRTNIIIIQTQFWLFTLLLLWILVFVLLCLLIWKSSSEFLLFTTFLNATSVILAVIAIGKSVAIISDAQQSKQQAHELDYAGLATTYDSRDITRRQSDFHDIYYIIIDGYARGDILQEIYQFDNSFFLHSLEEKGFYVAPKSHSNYNMTIMSVSSSLNFNYLETIVNQVGEDSLNPLPLIHLIENNSVIDYLRLSGYRFISFSSGYPGTEISTSDFHLGPKKKISPFLNEVINLTPIQIPLQRTQYDYHRTKIGYILENLPGLSEQHEEPLFVFAHLLAPHPPFVFDKEGKPLYPGTVFDLSDGSHYTEFLGRDQYINGYREQLEYVSDQILETVERILAQSSNPPIIIIQADHGPGSHLDWESVENTYIPERMSILNAYYFPDQNYNLLYPDITPVNTFRIVLDQYFGANLDLLEDRSFFSTMSRPFSFIDVTNQADQAYYDNEKKNE